MRRLRQGRAGGGGGGSSSPAEPGPVLERALLADLPERLRQPTFARTGGLHATGLFTPAGELVCVREDVGRHNAMDKVVGWALRRGAGAAAPARAVRERPAVVRARPEGRGRGRADAGRRRRADLAGRAAGRGPRHHARRLRARRARQRLHGDRSGCDDVRGRRADRGRGRVRRAAARLGVRQPPRAGDRDDQRADRGSRPSPATAAASTCRCGAACARWPASSPATPSPWSSRADRPEVAAPARRARTPGTC